MSKIKVEEVTYYESRKGLICYVRDSTASWSKIVDENMDDIFPGQELDISDNWIIQNGKGKSQQKEKSIGW